MIYSKRFLISASLGRRLYRQLPLIAPLHCLSTLFRLECPHRQWSVICVAEKTMATRIKFDLAMELPVGVSEATEEAGLALDSLGDQSSLESARKGARDRTLLMLGLTK